MKKCSRITNFKPEDFLRLLILMLFWQYTSQIYKKKSKFFKDNTITFNSLLKVIVHLCLIDEVKNREIRSLEGFLNYKIYVEAHSGTSIHGNIETNTLSWLITHKHNKGCTLYRNFIKNRRFELTHIGLLKAVEFEQYFIKYGFTKDVFLQAVRDLDSLQK